jgi:hypothetical protein
LGYRFLPKRLFAERSWQIKYKQILHNTKPVALKTNVTLGIIKNFEFSHVHYEAACLELGVPYKLIDIADNAWIENVKNSNCAAFLVWPSSLNNVSKQMFDERLRIIVKEMKKIIFPSYESLWIYESKRKMNDWLVLNNIPHAKTWVFFDKDKAMQFLETASLPLIFKTDLGSEASGVEIINNQSSGKRLVDICFSKGYLRKRSLCDDRDNGYILFQEYLPDVSEWRMIRLGNSFFGHQKLKKGRFHSGSKLVGWYEPPRKLLDFCRDVTEKGQFLSMDLDIFETPDGRYLVNELQAVFGSVNPSQMYINGKPGRFVYGINSKSWIFEDGYFCRNASCDLRVKTLLELLGKPLL